MTDAADNPAAPWHVAAAFTAWLLPGLGHYLLGERARGLILGVCIIALWLSGLFIGGVSVLDRQDHGIWFLKLAQPLLAPSLLVSRVSLPRLKAGRPAGPRPADKPAPAYVPSFARTKEQGVLYTALAGLLNLLAILDVLYREPRKPPQPPARHPEQPASAPRRALEQPAARPTPPAARKPPPDAHPASPGPRHGLTPEFPHGPTASRTATFAPAALPLWFAYTPLLDPIPVHQSWLVLLVPLSVIVAVVYKTIKLADLRDLPRDAAVLAVQIIAGMILAAGGLWLITHLA